MKLFIVSINLLLVIFFIYLLYNPKSDDLDLYYDIGNSSIHGIGCFSKKYIMPFTDLGIITVEGDDAIQKISDPSKKGRFFKTVSGINWREHRLLGRYINHSATPNCEVYRSSPVTFGVRTIKEIDFREEITINYKIIRDTYMNGNMEDLS